MTMRGIRGATTTDMSSREEMLERTRELLKVILDSNRDLKSEDIASVIFTTTTDLTAVHPAVAARQIGWDLVPMMCAQEISVPKSLPRCIRVLIHWNTDMDQKDIRHVYLHEAAALRPDLSR